MRKLIAAGFLFAGIFGANAQTISLTSATPSSSTTIGGSSSVRVGTNAGNSLTTGGFNTFLGRSAGALLTTGTNNTFTGYNSGSNSGCTLVPSACLTIGNFNSFYGSSSGNSNNGGNNNAFFGSSAGSKNTSGSNNTYLGFSAGSNNIGSGNVFIGSNSGPAANQLGSALSNSLFIDNVTNSTPLIWGDFAADQLKLNGKVGVGAVTSFPLVSGSVDVTNYRLFVTGGILTEEIRVALGNGSGSWADYVFYEDYDLKPLSEVENFIIKNGHLPNVPSAAQVQADGINVAEMARIQQEKIEELTLYLIQQNKEIELLKEHLSTLLNRK